MQALFELAEALGATVEYADLSHLGRDGDCDIVTRTIRLQPGMLYRLERSVLAHELGHLVRGDRRTFFGFYDDRDERKADEWAAAHLIDLAEFRAAEVRCGGNVGAIAQELGVIDDLVEAYERTLSRVGEHVYRCAKLGSGQWAERVLA